MLIKNSLVVVGACFVALACGSEVDVGGPRPDDGGAGGTSSSTPPNESEGGAAEPTEDPSSFANGQAPCETDADCCIVVDDCTNTAYVVGASDASHVAELIESRPKDLCTGCIGPSVQVSCQDRKCVGAAVTPADDVEAARLSQNHCGSVDDVQSDQEFRPIFGCGAR